MKSRLRLACALLIGLILAVPVTAWCENLRVVVLLSDDYAPYQSFANTFTKNLPPQIIASVLNHPEQLGPDMPQGDLIVAVGTSAVAAAIERNEAPVLSVMLPKSGFENLLGKAITNVSKDNVSAIYLDQPWTRQIDFWRAALPDRPRIGLLHTSNSWIDFSKLQHEIAQRNGMLVARPVHTSDDLFTTLENIMSISDVLIAIPDNNIYSSSNIRNILLSSYRRGIPLVGISQAYVNAGALCAIFSTPEQLANQAREAVVSYARSRKLPEPRFPDSYTISVNRQVARSMNLDVPSEEAIRDHMEKAERVRR
ncbi:MAG: ABC transporter substrate binding protein [Gallionella sp.]